ncbi:translation initiation factor IF-2-like [Psammomys obesus]|uniref:translation initiation factor IF-2-like n=1 Tax=Psammomys obesus TaxID=48139 RepID=UPI002452B99D|nr:translation initiation factor IF-2-like [Psammomys obesus]
MPGCNAEEAGNQNCEQPRQGSQTLLGTHLGKVGGGGWAGVPPTRAHTNPRGPRPSSPAESKPPEGVCARECVPAVTAPSSRARGLGAPWAQRGLAGDRPRRGASRRIKAWACRHSRAARPPVARGTGEGASRRRKALSAGRSGLRGTPEAQGGDRGSAAVPASRWVPGAPGAPQPAPSTKLSFLLRPTRKVPPRRGRRGQRVEGEEEVVPAGARPGRGNARAARPRPCSPPRPPAPPRLWRAEPRAPLAAAAADVAPAAPRKPTMPGRQNKREPLRVSPGLSLTLSGSRAGSRADRGRTPRGPEPRAPRLVPADPGLHPLPPRARPPHRRKACRTLASTDSWSPGIRPYCPRGALRARPRSPAAPARAPSGLREQAGGRLGNRRQTPPPPLPSGRRCAPGFSFLFFFFFQS